MVTPTSLSSSQSEWTALSREADTAWAPDPWGYQAMAHWPIVDDAFVHALDVPFVGGRIRKIPVLSPGLHLKLDRAVSHLSSSLDLRLSQEVCGYRPGRDGHWIHYRDELERRFALEDALALQWPVAARVDLKRFFPSITMEHLDRLFLECPEPRVTESIRDGLSVVRSSVGHLIPEGYAFARALASLTISDIDQSIDSPFVRWLDDYTIFGNSHDEVADTIESLRVEAERSGFRLNTHKTQILNASELSRSRSGSLVDMHSSTMEAEVSIRPNSDEREVRYALRIGAQRNDPALLESLQGILDDLPESTFPRLAWYLRSVIRCPTASHVAEELINTRSNLTDWTLLRLSSVLWYSPRKIDDGTLEKLVKASWRNGALFPIVARVLAKKEPALISVLPDPGSSTDERVHSLACQEARIGGHELSRAVNFQNGPPVVSYL